MVPGKDICPATMLRKPSFLRKARPTPSCQRCPTHLKVMMLGCLSFLKCLISVSLRSRTFLTATSSPWKRPRKTAPCAPLPTHCKSMISSKGTSHGSAWRGKESGSCGLFRGRQVFHPQGKKSCIMSFRNNQSHAYHCRNKCKHCKYMAFNKPSMHLKIIIMPIRFLALAEITCNNNNNKNTA